jgi:hypothetical protein
MVSGASFGACYTDFMFVIPVVCLYRRSTAVFAFGPPASGKTYTMFGVEAHVISGEIGEDTSGNSLP